MNKGAIIFGLSILFFVISLVYFNIRHAVDATKQIEETISPEEEVQRSLRDPNADSDGDGLLNWEEELYGSSKKNKDSDGDGVDDGAEVALGSDPTIYGQITFQQDTQQISENVYDPGFNPTKPPVSLEDLQGLLQGDPQALQGFLQDQLGDTGGQSSTLDARTSMLKNQLNQLATILDDSIISNQLDDEEILLFVNGKTNSTVALERLRDTNKIAYEKTESLLMTLDDDIAYYARIFSQQHRIMSESLSSVIMSGPGNNTAGAIASWQTYSQANETWIKTLVSVNAYVRARGIIFRADEPGHLFAFEISG